MCACVFACVCVRACVCVLVHSKEALHTSGHYLLMRVYTALFSGASVSEQITIARQIVIKPIRLLLCRHAHSVCAHVKHI